MQPDPHLVYQNETIVAVATPPGRGGIGIVRLSGPEATGIAEPMLRLRNPLAHAQARFADLLDLDTQEKLDEAVACTVHRSPLERVVAPAGEDDDDLGTVVFP